MSSISVIIPAYNCGRYLAQAIESALGQSRPPEEIIVVDDGSTDDTAAVAQAFGNRIRLIRQRNGGPAAARNAGLREASGEFVAFLDGDDIWFPYKLELQVPWLVKHPEVALLSATTLEFWDHPQAVPAAPLELEAELVPLEFLFIRNCIDSICVLARQAAIESVGGFDERWRGPEDYDLWLRLAARHRVARTPTPLSHYRIVPTGLAHGGESMKRQLLQIQARFCREYAPQVRWSTRRQGKAFAYAQAAWVHQSMGRQRKALADLATSMLLWPWRFRRGILRYKSGRWGVAFAILRKQ